MLLAKLAMPLTRPCCPSCHSKHVVKNGRIHNGKQNYRGNDCGRQFVQDPPNKVIDAETKRLIAKLLLEKSPLAGIARVTEVSAVWLQQYVNAKDEQVPRQVTVSAKKKGRLTLEGDEAWSFVGDQGHKQWLWLALDRSTREMVGVHMGDRSQDGAQALWASLPAV